uniref:carboxylesterase n=1 Tax=Anopheles merus TaxID=30066 RepID=A0A182UY99_ANOME
MASVQMSSAAALLVLAIASIAGTSVAQDDQTPVVRIGRLGSVMGTMGETAWTGRPIYKFFNVKYAEAPVGRNRFLRPRSVRPWTGVMNATVPGRACPQRRTLSQDDPDAEDCLTLSIYSNNLTANRPVMLYVHGGAFVVGSAERFGPEYLLEKDIVLVVIQYRLGTLGFLSTGTKSIPGNAAMYDVLESLEWVSRHIRSFGGNPEDVTIFGESAGGHAVSAMLHSPRVREGLFKRAIIQSGTLFMPWVICQDPTEGAYEMASIIGCNMTTPAEIDRCLKNASVRDLVLAQDQHKRNEFSSPGYPKVAGACITVGGAYGNQSFMPVHPRESTYFRDVEIIFGMNSQEGLIFFNEYFRYALDSQPIEFDSHWDSLEFLKTVNIKFGSGAFVDAVVGYELLSKATWEEMDRANFSEIVPLFIDVAGNLALKYGSVEEANRFARALPGQVYLYNFDYVGPPSPVTPGFPYDFPNTVGHGDELKFLFPMSNVLNEEHTQMAKIMVDLWTSFAITGKPQADNVMPWPTVSNDLVVNIQGLGSVMGTMGKTAWTGRPIYQFFNIKYAEAPVGEQRFRAPISVRPWTGVMNVTAPGRGCPQRRTVSQDDPNAEDCLTLSVYSNDLTANRPVMLYVHGGAFVAGSAERFGPEYLLEKDIVLVVIQYRLGTLGFLSTGTEAIPGNAAMYDVLESLEWVSRHIRSFGGNPEDVTIFGESAGGHAVSA